MTAQHFSNMAFKMEELRQQHSCTDIIMTCRGGDVYAHRNVLLATCPYFEKMFTVEMLEKNTGCVQFLTSSKDVIEIIVKYLYTAQIPNLDNDCNLLNELIKTSHMMDLEDLYVNCWKQSSDNVNVENFADLWAVGVYFGLEKEGSIEHFAKDNMKEIVENANVQILSLAQITKLIDCVDQKRFCNECIECIFKWKSIRLEREEDAANLLGKFELKYLDDKSLHNLLESNCRMEKKETVETVLIREAAVRLLQSDANKSICKLIMEKSNMQIGPTIGRYRIALDIIKDLCENLHL